MKTTPNLFIVGAPKCGTTALHYYLGQHPDIFMSSRKEPCFFASDFVSNDYITDPEAYENLFAKGAGRTYRGEATATYLYSSCAAQEIREFCPDAICIIMLRHPADMIYSLHGQRTYEGVEHLLDFEQALKAEERRKQGERFACSSRCPIEYLFYREMAHFLPQVQRFVDTFPRENLIFLSMEELHQNTQGVVQSLFSRLGLPPCEIDTTRQRQGVSWKSPLMRKLVASRYAPHLARLIPQTIRSNVFKPFSNPRPRLSRELREMIMAEYQDQVIPLQNITGLDLQTLWH